jgi:glycosyltransferase involved in cell wall biosynthesis
LKRPGADSIRQSRPRLAEIAEVSFRIGFLCPHNPLDKSAFSGTPYHAARALAAVEGVDLRLIGGHRPRAWHDRLTRRFRKPQVFAPQPQEFQGLDIVVGLVATSFLVAAAAVTRAPLVHVTDATPAFLREFYGGEVSRESELGEAQALSLSRLAVYSSDYMVMRAQAEYGPDLDAELVAIPFGANCDLPTSMPEKTKPDPLRLLWVGSRWERKGGEIALAAFDLLRAEGRAVELTLVGDVPRDLPPRPGLRVEGYLDKNRPAEAKRLARLYADAHVFLLPTRADCTPMVIAEAGAHGTPTIVTDTGGIGSLVSEGVNGRMLPLEAGPADWARAVVEMAADPAAHAALCRSSFAHVQTCLTWDAWARRLVERLRTAAANGTAAT